MTDNSDKSTVDKVTEEGMTNITGKEPATQDKMGDNQTVCHIHDGDNNHVGTGKDYTLHQALEEAAKEAQGKGKNLRKGSFGCGDSDDEAHDRATSSNSSNATGLPGTSDFL